MTYNICKHVGVIPYQAENLHFSIFRRGIQGQQPLGFGALVYCPGDDRQRAVASEIRGIDLSESGFLIAGPADDASGSVPERPGDIRGVFEDVRRGECSAGCGIEGPEGERVEAGDQNTGTQSEFVYDAEHLL